QEVAGGVALSSPDLALDRGAIDEQGERRAHGGIGEERMRRLDVRALTVDVAPRIGLVELDVVDVRRATDDDSAFAAVLEGPKDLVLHVEAPRVVVLTGLQHRARRRHRIPSTLE